MSKNFIKRLYTSFILLALLLLVNFTNYFIFIISITILGFMICVEANNISLKLVGPLFLKQKKRSGIKVRKFNFKFLILNTVIFCYVFFIFCQFSYKIHSLESPTFFLFVISICFFTDIGGYTFGKILGGKKLTKISPNKTISGTIGSFVFSIIPLSLFANLNNFELEFNLSNLMFSLLISFVSQVGDLFISYLKRSPNIKDTGKILPGHGGVLDRVDGILFAIPFSYIMFTYNIFEL